MGLKIGQIGLSVVVAAASLVVAGLWWRIHFDGVMPFNHATSGVVINHRASRGDQNRPVVGIAANRKSNAPSADFADRIAALKTADGAGLLSYFKQGLEPSASFENKYLASQVFTFCSGHVNPRVFTNQNTHRREDHVPLEDPRAALLADKIDVMSGRCAPLAEVGVAHWREAGGRLGRELAAEGSPFAQERLTSDDGNPVSQDKIEEVKSHVRDMLDTYGVVALQWTGASLLDLGGIEKMQPGQLELLPKDSDSIALILATCYAGQPCGSDSLEALGLCIGSGGDTCQDDVVQSSLHALNGNDEKRRAEQLGHQLSDAVQSRDWHALGLD